MNELADGVRIGLIFSSIFSSILSNAVLIGKLRWLFLNFHPLIPLDNNGDIIGLKITVEKHMRYAVVFV